MTEISSLIRIGRLYSAAFHHFLSSLLPPLALLAFNPNTRQLGNPFAGRRGMPTPVSPALPCESNGFSLDTWLPRSQTLEGDSDGASHLPGSSHPRCVHHAPQTRNASEQHLPRHIWQQPCAPLLIIRTQDLLIAESEQSSRHIKYRHPCFSSTYSEGPSTLHPDAGS